MIDKFEKKWQKPKIAGWKNNKTILFGIVVKGGQILILLSNKSQNQWQLPMVEQGPTESPEDCLRRGIKGQTGLDVEVIMPLIKINKFFLIKVKKESQELILSKKYQASSWVSKDKFSLYDFPEVIKKVTEEIFKIKILNNLDFFENFWESLDERKRKILEKIETSNKSIFISGRAGTGKSYLIDGFRNITMKNVVVLAPTGVAAVNVGGETIHSFFHFKPNITPSQVSEIETKYFRELYRVIDTIIIDEISMVRSDLLDCVDEFLKLHRNNFNSPFGGVQMIFIGDPYQLPPVVTDEEEFLFDKGDYVLDEYYTYKSPYFFNAKSYEYLEKLNLLDYVLLTKVYRQKEEEREFINILDSIRTGSITDSMIELLNKRYAPGFEPKEDEGYIYLATTKNIVNEINSSRLDKLHGKLYLFRSYVSGSFPEKHFPAPKILELKEGAQVMLLNNDASDRWVNGDIGRVVEIKNDGLKVEIQNRGIFDVGPYSWEKIKFRFNKELRKIESVVEGKFIQYPLKLAWATTIHKAQGKTFDRAIIDFGKGTFAPGQAYVALSRCTSLSGLVLKQPIEKRYIFIDNRVGQFMKKIFVINNQHS